VKGADARSIIGKSDLIRIVIYLINNNLPQPLRRRGVQETGLIIVVDLGPPPTPPREGSAGNSSA